MISGQLSRLSFGQGIRSRPNSRWQPARSLDWYETVVERMHLDPLAFAYDYMILTGQMPGERLVALDGDFVAAYRAGDHSRVANCDRDASHADLTRVI